MLVAEETFMQVIWTPGVLLFLVSVAILVAFLVASELLADPRRTRQPVHIPISHERTAWTMHQLPRASRPPRRDSRLAAVAIRRVAPD
jgi:hypothetical protein